MKISVMPLIGVMLATRVAIGFFLTMVSPIVFFVAVAFYYLYAFSSNLEHFLGINQTVIQ
jgi:hypothetical protein